MRGQSTNVVWQERKVTPEAREERNGHKGCVVWFTGLSASGKSTISIELEKKLFENHFNVFLLDGDNLRHGLNRNLGFSPADREENIRRVAELCKLYRNSGFIVLAAFISPYKRDRDIARNLVDEGRFCEIFVKASLDACVKRDPKGLYKKALAGEIAEFTGVSSPYEEPESPELILDTEKLAVEESVEKVYRKLIDMKIISE